jgi:hypothetical protein
VGHAPPPTDIPITRRAIPPIPTHRYTAIKLLRTCGIQRHNPHRLPLLINHSPCWANHKPTLLPQAASCTAACNTLGVRKRNQLYFQCKKSPLICVTERLGRSKAQILSCTHYAATMQVPCHRVLEEEEAHDARMHRWLRHIHNHCPNCQRSPTQRQVGNHVLQLQRSVAGLDIPVSNSTYGEHNILTMRPAT